MKRQLIGVFASLMAASALIAAQGTATPPQQGTATPAQSATAKPSSDITVTGCLTQGSSPEVFILDNARQKPDDKTEKAQSYVVVGASEDLPFAANLNHEVSVTGSADAKSAAAAPAGQKVAEQDMPRFSAKNVTLVADRCATQTR
jgi:hypothetical protein